MADNHYDTIMNYIADDGSHWTARWMGDNFYHNPEGNPAGHPDSIINYLTWDGTRWRARWDASTSCFIHTNLATGAEHPDKIINYLTWDNSLWTAVRDGNGFYHIFVADAQEDPGIFPKIVDFFATNGDLIKVIISLF